MTEQQDTPQHESFEERIAALEAQKRGSRWSNVKIALVTMLVATGVAIAVTSYWVPRAERHARTVAIEQAAKAQAAATKKANEISYKNQLASCRRGISVRVALRRNALATQKVFDVTATADQVLHGFFQGARPRAAAQGHDPNISAVSRKAALKSVASIDNAITVFDAASRALSVKLTIPPKPTPCDQVIQNPNAPAPQHHN